MSELLKGVVMMGGVLIGMVCGVESRPQTELVDVNTLLTTVINKELCTFILYFYSYVNELW